ncbi:efflux RND transporter periplasmic adaptor subunit [Tellurirhabdus rosea]|uniref:efflux RND transporter periplasmic adaptor subunit n=1 Tax=Tellurirhabdus rosea TaxID=2674997 RepID=UPI00225AAFBF|nr:efflux RND transporter periplasmic adaptor subunit [Tellurirhabdus rosea]
MNPFTKRILTVGIIVLVTGIAFYPRLKPLLESKAEKGAEAAAKPAPGGGKAAVEVMVVRSHNLDEKILTTGTILANEEVEIRPEVSGRVTSINFREGDYVRRGTVLLTINDADLKAQLQKLMSNRKLAEDNEARQRRLLEKEAISRQEYEISQTNLSGILADIENLKAQLDKTVIRAPFDGNIGLRYVSLGSYISSSTKIATLTNVTPAKLDFSIPAKYAGQVRKGSTIRFTVEGSEVGRTGQVYAVEPKVDPETRTLLLRAVSPNADRMLVPGAFAKIEVVLSSRGSAIVIPTEAIIPEASGQKVFVLRHSKAESVKVEIGTRTDRSVEIRTGLQPGDSLITSGIQLVKPGGEVEVRNIL